MLDKITPYNLTVIILILVGISFIFSTLLGYLNQIRWKSNLPSHLYDFYSEEAYQKAKNYSADNYKVSLIQSTLTIFLTNIVILFGLFGQLADVTGAYFPKNAILADLLFFGVIMIVSSIIGLPFQLYDTFIIEQKYGFNNITIGTWLLDKLKGFGLLILIGLPISYLLLYIIYQTGPNFWIYAWLIMSFFSILISLLYVPIFVPIFNKLSPLPAGELNDEILKFAKKTNFPLAQVVIMNGSKRSSKGNAFFTGLGPVKKIVLFDTLIQKHSTAELVAILAHEVGHYKGKHIYKGLAVGLFLSAFTLFLFSTVSFLPQLSLALGSKSIHLGLNIIVFGILYTPISSITGYLSSLLSRKHEYEADKYSSDHYSNEAMQSALKKLSIDNLSNPDPHPIVVALSYTHPTVIQRINALKAIRD